MLLVIDVGNTNIVLGIYSGQRLVCHWRIHTERNSTEDEFNVLIMSLFANDGITAGDIHQTIISSVVPPMVGILDAFCLKYLGRAPHWVDPKTSGVMPIRYSNPAEVGADRIVNAVAAYERYQSALIVIDFGTATTFDAISKDGAYLGGAISPGIMISAEALFQKASKLPRVEIFKKPASVIGTDTISSIQSGIICGYAGLVDGMVARMREELGGSVKTVATGGLAPLIQASSTSIEAVVPELTIEGLRIIAEKVASQYPAAAR